MSTAVGAPMQAPTPPPMTAPVPGFASASVGIGSSGAILLSGLHFGAAMLFLIAGAAGLVWVAPDMARGMFLAPRVAGVTHLFTLGWLTITIFGALYQLLPVALGTPVRSVRAGYASIALMAPGVALFAAGVAMNDDPIRHGGVALVIPALLIGIANVGASLVPSTRRDLTWWSVLVALTALTSTLLLGAVLLHNLKTGFLLDARLRVLSLHLHIALVGWALTMIIGMSQRLLPMFLLAHGVTDRWGKRALALLAGGTTLLSIGLLTHPAVTWAGAIALSCGVGSFIVQALAYFRARVRRRLDAGMRFFVTALAFMIVSSVLGLLTMARGTGSPRIATAYVTAGLLGGIVLYVVGHFYKVVPFLAWIVRFRGRMGRERVPAVADLYSARVANIQWAVMTFGVTAVTAGTLAGHAHCVRAGALFFGAGTLLLVAQMLRVSGFFRPRSS